MATFDWPAGEPTHPEGSLESIVCETRIRYMDLSSAILLNRSISKD